MKQTLRFSVVIMLAVLLGSGLSLAQDPRGTILGRVTDSTSAVIPGVEIRATNTDTGVAASGITNDSGNYTIPFLLPGVYQVTAELPGFKKLIRNGIQVRVSEPVEVNLQLEIGEVTESIEVVSDTPLLDTVGSTLGQVIDERRISELPLLAGNPTELALLTPGVINATNLRLRKPAFNNGLSQIATDGNEVKSNEFQIDGISNTFAEGSGNSRIAFSPPVSAVKQFKIQTTPYDASIGHTIGSLVNVSTASGTNQLHGELHYWARNSAFDAPNFFNNKANTEPPVYQDHRYGASAGGPVYVPGLYDGRNKTFWYYAYEGNKWGVPGTATRTVPTAAQRQGDFSELLAIDDRYQIFDPATTAVAEGGRFSRQPFANNIIPADRLSPVGMKLAQLYPLPNQPGTSDGRNNFFFATKGLEDYYVHFARVDHSFSERHRMFVRVHYDWWEEDKADDFGTGINGIFLFRINRGLALDNVFVLNPTLIFNVRYGITSQDFPEERRSQGFDLAGLGFSQNLLSLLPDPENAPIPRLTLSPYAQISDWESGDGGNTSLTHSLSGNFTQLMGNHNLKFGTDFRAYRGFGSRIPTGIAPDFEFNELYTRGPFDNSPSAPIGQELASLLLGIPDGVMSVTATSALQDKYLAFYFHDDFKLNKKLTLNLGLRYEYESPITERFDRLVSGFAFGVSNPIEAQARANYAANPIPELSPEDFRVQGGLTFVGDSSLGRNPYKGETNNLLPRIGLAYQLTPNTVLRTGYGIFFDTIGVNGTRAIQTGFSQNTPIQASLDNGLTFIADTANPLPNGLLQPLGPAGSLTTNLGQGLSFYFSDRKNPYSQRFSLGLQHLLPGDFLVEASYVGNRSTRLGINRNINNIPAEFLSTSGARDQATINFLSAQFPNPFFGVDPIYGQRISRGNLLRPYPHFGGISVEEPIGYAWYHSLQTRAEKRFSRGYTFQLGYTWSKLMEAVQFLNATDPTPYEVIGSLDRPHRLTMSGIWEIPFGRGRRYGSALPSALNGIVGGWQITGVTTFQSGAALNFGNIIFNGDIQDIPLKGSTRDADRWFNTEAGFNKNSREQLGSNIRTFPLRLSGVRSDNQHRWDFSLIKNFPIREEVRVQFRAEVYNALNMTSFNNPNTAPTNSSFGRITGTAADARNWQFALKLEF